MTTRRDFLAHAAAAAAGMAAGRSGVRHFFVERDQSPTPEDTLRASYRYLSALRVG